MTKDETRKLLMMIDATFPSFKVENPESTVDSWYFALQDYDAGMIMAAFKIYMSTSGSAFAPSVPELIAATRKPQELTQTGEIEAWTQVRKAIRNGIYNYNEEYSKLPEMIQKAVGCAEQLKMWAMLPSDDIDTVVRSNFRKTYELLIRRAAEYDALPPEIKKIMDNINERALIE